ncbi:MAG: ComF family protein [Clostridia bacterium]|nr:ComF family protein [Clostridia bacterium]
MAENCGRVSLFERLAFPTRCAACRELLDWYDTRPVAFCPACEKKWVSETLERCGICGARVTDCTCMPLAMQKAKCERLYKLVYYTPRDASAVQNKLIYRLKNGTARRSARFAGEAMRAQMEGALRALDVRIEDALITYLPRAHRKRLQTGTDQARVLAREISRGSGVPMKPLLARRWNANREQKKLSPKERLTNAKRAYVARKRAECKGKTVVLVDDLVTTGAGMATATRILRRMGARRVICLTLAADAINKDLMHL